MHICDRCGMLITGTTMVLSFGDRPSGTYCTDCNNEIIAKRLGISYQREDFGPYEITDASGNEHAFEFEIHYVPAGISIRAHESLLSNEDAGYKFEILGDFDCNPRELYAELLKKMGRALQHSHLEVGAYNESLKDIVRGRIGYSELGEVLLVIDGRGISLDRFGQMLDSYGGFQFRLEFVDPSDEVE